jgi:multidrug transporter EmrE-like cation transporter
MRNTSALLPIVLAVTGGVLYHVSAKSVPRDLAPGLVLVVAYATALAISGIAHPWLPSSTVARGAWPLLHPAVLGLGLGAALIELGYVLTYRAAWPVSVASVVVNGMVAALLVPAGLLAFGEHVSLLRVAGMVLCLAGVWLLRH